MFRYQNDYLLHQQVPFRIKVNKRQATCFLVRLTHNLISASPLLRFVRERMSDCMMNLIECNARTRLNDALRNNWTLLDVAANNQSKNHRSKNVNFGNKLKTFAVGKRRAG